MIKRLLLVLLASAASASAQTTAFGTKATANATAPADSAATAPATKGASKVVEEEVDNSVVITPFRSLTPPEAKTSRTFQLSRVNKLGFTETTKELQRLYSAFATQRIVDGSPSGSSKATGYLATVNYSLLQDLGDNRFLAKAAWPAAGPNEALAAGADTMAVLLLDKPAKVGDTGKITGMHVGTVALLFTANYAPLTGKRFTLRREAFVECATLEDSPAGLQKFVEAVSAGAEMSATTNEQISCKKCGGFGQIREPQKGSLTDKLTPCAECTKGKVIISVETKFIP
ncbi:MAG: hypothetical protein CK553_00345 [Opitutia bacterium]|nr:MAG: hypothetical protein CK553_00345 [Opitutae bacterium]